MCGCGAHGIASDGAADCGARVGAGDEVPFFDGPAFDAPPVAGEIPGAPGALDGVALVAEDETCGAALVQGDGDGFGGTQTAMRGAGLRLGFVDDGGGGRDGERFHTKRIGTVSVFEDGAADALFTDDGADAGEGYVETRGLGELRGEEAELDFACCSGIRGEGDGENGSRGRVRLQIEMKETEPEAAVVIGERGTDGAGVGSAAFEHERDGDGGEGENLRGGAGDEVIEEDAEDEEERVEELHGRVEFDALFESEGRVGGHEEALGFSASQLAQALAFLAQARS